MTDHTTTNPWLRRGLIIAGVAVLMLAFFLIPRMTSGQEGGQDYQELLQPDMEHDAYVIEGDVIADASGKPYVLNLGAFHGDGEDTGNYQITFNGFFNSKAINPQICYVSPVFLPDGAVVTAFDMYFVDNHSFFMDAYLQRKRYTPGATAATEYLASIITPGAANPAMVHMADTTINLATIDNNSYHYYATVCPWQPEHQVYGVRVFYTE